jgi:hypothetical protein
LPRHEVGKANCDRVCCLNNPVRSGSQMKSSRMGQSRVEKQHSRGYPPRKGEENRRPWEPGLRYPLAAEEPVVREAGGVPG